MLRNKITIIVLIFFFLFALLVGPFEMQRSSGAIDVTDGTLTDWIDAPLSLNDPLGDSSVSMTDLSFVAFDYDDTWFYVRWDLYDNLSYKAGVLYDMGINLSAVDPPFWEIYVSAEIDLVGGLPVIANISIRDDSNNHIWNASDDGNMTEDGSLYMDPTPGLPLGNLSVEARFPLSRIGITSGVIFGQFRSHSSPSVNSAVKDRVPDAGYIVLIIDNLRPDLRDLMDYPDPQNSGDFVNITVNVTDDIAVDTVWVNITLPDSSWVNESMLWSGGDIWFYNDTYNIPGIYYYTVWANDSGDNWNYTGPGDFTILDNNAPQFDNLIDTPDPQIQGDFVNITVDVTDDIGVYDVWINITYPNSSWSNITMQSGLGDEYYYNITYDDLGIFWYTVWANDTNDNWNNSGPGSFTIGDNIGPELSNLADTPDPQENDYNVNITVDVTDDIAVDEVWLNITYPDNSYMNISMQHGSGNEWYYNMTYGNLGLHSYTVWANDTSDNWNTTGPETFAIQDTDPPMLSVPVDTPDPQEIGGYVDITVDVTDDVAVDSVWINITYVNGSQVNISMIPGIGDEWHFNAIFYDLGLHSYFIWANDTSNNFNYTGIGTFIIQETEQPKITDVDDNPDPQENGEIVNITVNVTDNIAVDNVWIEITYPNGSQINVSMTQGSGDSWYFDNAYDDLDVYSYTIWARDINNNWNSSGPETFSIYDSDLPEFIDVIDRPDPQENGHNVNITATIIDDVGVLEVWVNITYIDGSWINTTMIHGAGDEWYYDTTYGELGLYPYIVYARDVADNWNFAGPNTFTIQDTEPPMISNLVDAPDPQENGGRVNIIVNIIDDIAVDEVWIDITYPDSSTVNTSMVHGTDDTWYFDAPYSDLDDYSYRIWASDTSDNWNSSSPRSFTIRDTDKPEIGDPDCTPETQDIGGGINISVDVTDDVGVEEVWINIIFPNGSSFNFSMDKGPGDEWFYNGSYNGDGNYTYIIWAVDPSGNWNSTNPETFTIEPEPPEEPPNMLYMTLVFIYWPLLLIIFIVVLLWREGFDNRFKRDIDQMMEALSYLYAEQPEHLPESMKTIQAFITLSLKTGIPVEEFLLAALSAKSMAHNGLGLSGKAGDDLIAIESLFKK